MKRGKFRKAVFVVLYSKKGKTKKYLLLKRKLHWAGWEFPKGGIKGKESEINAVKREVREETGLEVLSIKKFNLNGKYFYDRKWPDRPGIIGQTYTLFGAQVKKGKAKVDGLEHTKARWFKFEKAYKKLTWVNQKRCLAKVERNV